MVESTTPADVAAIQPHDPYAALRHREFRWYIISLFAMVVGSQLQAVVVGWQVYGITHDPLSLGLIGLAEALPFIARRAAGRLSRRSAEPARDQRRLALRARLLLDRAPRASAPRLALLARVGIVPIYAVIFVSGIARGILQPARQALERRDRAAQHVTRTRSPGAAAPGRRPR